ncbi:MAG TPA: hypothetical protein VGD73_28555 [Pseudonocardia sp.]|jgi:hypothetical protein|uniref:hypothetical protein n=1 Tax=Pseudonocardia sp. TaxID=60912 RepID=UPI002EDABE80
MTADHSSDSGRQRTVAELLEQYGGEGHGGGGRRRRRGGQAEAEAPAGASRPEEPTSAEKAAAEQTWSSFSAVAHEQPAYGSPGGPSAVDVPADSPWSGYGSTGLSGYSPGAEAEESRNGASSLDQPGGSEWARPGATVWAHPGSDPLPASGTFGGYPLGTANGSAADSYPVDSYPLDAYPAEPELTKPPEVSTEQLPRYANRRGGPSTGPITDPMPQPAIRPAAESLTGTGAISPGAVADTAAISPGAVPGAMSPGAVGATAATRTGATRTGAGKVVGDSGPSTAISAPADLFDDGDDEAGAAPGRRGKGRAKAAARAAAASMVDVPAGLGADEPELDEAESGWKAWAILIAQGIGGAVGGALLWVGFRYLWLNLPVVALAAAVVATAGLVLVVRTIRGSDDLQTTMLAVLVGLIVTISPAVLLLALH